MIAFYLVCFVLGLVLSLLAAFAGLGRLHLGHVRAGHLKAGHVHASGQMSALNGFTLPAFLCWFGGAGYLLERYSPAMTPVVLVAAAGAGLLGASMLYAAIFKVLLPRERVLSADDTRMDGVVARVSDEIRDGGGIGEILFSQTGGRRSAAARSETGVGIERGTEVVVLRYARGVAWVSPLGELVGSGGMDTPLEARAKTPG